MRQYPKILCHPYKLEVALYPYGELQKLVNVEFVLDINYLKNVTGIEILNLKTSAGKHCLEFLESYEELVDSGLRYSYDDESDSFYLEISDEASIDQKAVNGTLILNELGQIIGFMAEIH